MAVAGHELHRLRAIRNTDINETLPPPESPNFVRIAESNRLGSGYLKRLSQIGEVPQFVRWDDRIVCDNHFLGLHGFIRAGILWCV